jgi:hypothetical protein
MREVEEVGVDRDKRTGALVASYSLACVCEPDDNVILGYTQVHPGHRALALIAHGILRNG